MNYKTTGAQEIRSSVTCTLPSDLKRRAKVLGVAFSLTLEEALKAKIDDLERAGRSAAETPTTAIDREVF